MNEYRDDNDNENEGTKTGFGSGRWFPQDRRLAIIQRYWEELIELEEGFEKELTLLLGKYNPDLLEEETIDSLEGRDKRGARDIETEWTKMILFVEGKKQHIMFWVKRIHQFYYQRYFSFGYRGQKVKPFWIGTNIGIMKLQVFYYYYY
ncbi:hypothetical protein PVK06_039088 [Gossypium arboreum]|uniref:Uncharacterized protein n=1 Tax=Gossypium arboreum TaxID=29729 RepID=A0ABR0N2J7_GOSAR|nr:hypothetical protein PVK06_039088 [Gossypium arboreum]